MEPHTRLRHNIDIAVLIAPYTSFQMKGAFYLARFRVYDDEGVDLIDVIVGGVDIVSVREKHAVGRKEIAGAIIFDDVHILTIDFHHQLMVVGDHILQDTIFIDSYGITDHVVEMVFLRCAGGVGLPFFWWTVLSPSSL